MASVKIKRNMPAIRLKVQAGSDAVVTAVTEAATGLSVRIRGR